jgi:hypothetical protein
LLPWLLCVCFLDAFDFIHCGGQCVLG